MNTIFILGSCVSRDAFGPHTLDFKIEAYVARTSLASAFYDCPFKGVSLDNIESPFQKRMVDIDINKQLENLLSNTKADIILFDPIDERFNLYKNKEGAICTASNELVSSGFLINPQTITVIQSGSEEFYELWEKGWCEFVQLLKQQRLFTRLRVNKVYWSLTHEDGKDFLPAYSSDRIVLANKFLNRLYKRMSVDLSPEQFITYPLKLLLGNVGHRWGSSPFHYVDSFYKFMIQNLKIDTSVLSLIQNDKILELGRLPLIGEMRWYEVQTKLGATLFLEAELESALGVSERRALLSIEFGDQTKNNALMDGFGKSHNPSIGQYRYFSTGSGKLKTSFYFTLPNNISSFRIGLRSWWPENEVVLNWLSLTVPQKSLSKPSSIITVDVEALPGRSERSENAVENLIFGRFGNGQSYGIERLCNIFDIFGIRATFFVDYSTCILYGDDGIFKAAEFLKKRGHDVQLHVHSEVLVRNKHWQHNPLLFPSFENLNKDIARDCLEFCIEKFQINLGYLPCIFRPGGMKLSFEMYEAVKQVGIQAVSALYRGHWPAIWSNINKFAIFQWENGVLELPLDLALDPLPENQQFTNTVDLIFQERFLQPVLSVLIHSTSLLYRAINNEPPHFINYHKPYDDVLVQYLHLLSNRSNFITYSELLNVNDSPKSIKFDDVFHRENINVINTPDNSKAVLSGISNQLTIELPAYKIPNNINYIEQFVPPTSLPLKLAQGQYFDIYEILHNETGKLCNFVYIVTGNKAYIMRQRGSLPGGELLQKILESIFNRYPFVENIIAESVLEESTITTYSIKHEVRRAFILDLPLQFQKYQSEVISNQLRRDIEREERRVKEIWPNIKFKCLAGNNLNKDLFIDASNLIESHLKRKEGLRDSSSLTWRAADVIDHWDLYRKQGMLFTLMDFEQIYAVAICLSYEGECYFMAAGHLEYATKYSLGKILLYRLIEELINSGINRFHMGGGDFGYKSRFGAIECPLYTFHFERSMKKSLKDGIISALELGQSPALLELGIKEPLEEVFGTTFESVLNVDFDSIMENRELGTDLNAARYQATIREAFVTLMSYITPGPDDIFVDVGCGKGKMLYYASQLGYKTCVGIELSEMLIQRSYANLSALKLPSRIQLLQRDASQLDAQEISKANIFYLYNPFSEKILTGFLQTVIDSQLLNPRKVLIIYCNSRYETPFRTLGFNIVKVFETGQSGWRFDKSTIFERM